MSFPHQSSRRVARFDPFARDNIAELAIGDDICSPVRENRVTIWSIRLTHVLRALSGNSTEWRRQIRLGYQDDWTGSLSVVMMSLQGF